MDLFWGRFLQSSAPRIPNLRCRFLSCPRDRYQTRTARGLCAFQAPDGWRFRSSALLGSPFWVASCSGTSAALRQHSLAVQKSSPRRLPWQPMAAEPAGATACESERVDINTASADDLNRLGGRIGKAIIAGRPYRSADELVSKRVLTRSTFNQIKDRITPALLRSRRRLPWHRGGSRFLIRSRRALLLAR